MKDRKTRGLGISKTVILVLLLSGLFLSAAYAATNGSVAFKDTVGHWASSSIQKLSDLGILGGYPDGTFKPDNKVSRAEVAVIVDRALGVSGQEEQASAETIAKGGRLFDSWVDESSAAQPAGDQPLWASQTINTRSGAITWRCKECHGWDLKGYGGAYNSGSHATGFPGVYKISSVMNKAELVDALKGSINYKHDFSSYLSDKDLESIADFLKDGAMNYNLYVDYATKKPVGANVVNGKKNYETACAACHGNNGTQLNFGTEQKPEYVDTIAKSNPWEFIHKVRFGHAGSAMPYAAQNGWTMQNVVDVLGYTQTLQQ